MHPVLHILGDAEVFEKTNCHHFTAPRYFLLSGSLLQ